MVPATRAPGDEPVTDEAGAPVEGEGAAGAPATGEADITGEPDVPEGSQETVDLSGVPAPSEDAGDEGAGDAAPVDGAEGEPAGGVVTGLAPADGAANGLPAEVAPSEEAAPLAKDDTEAPAMGSGMSVSTKRATAGDKVTFTIRASDEGTGLRGASLWLVNRDTGDTWTVSLDAAEDGTMTGLPAGG